MYFIFLVLATLAPWRVDPPRSQAGHALAPLFSCAPEMAALFAPRRPQLGRYDVCTTDRPIEEVADPAWLREALAPVDAFGRAGAYDAHALSRLYLGGRALVARGWIRTAGGFESITLISPHPDVTLTRLVQGTLRIRLIICCQ